MTEMFGEAWSPMSVPDLAPDDDDDLCYENRNKKKKKIMGSVSKYKRKIECRRMTWRKRSVQPSPGRVKKYSRLTNLYVGSVASYNIFSR